MYISKQVSIGTCDFIPWRHLEVGVEHGSELSYLKVGKLGHLFTIFHFALTEVSFSLLLVCSSNRLNTPPWPEEAGPCSIEQYA